MDDFFETIRQGIQIVGILGALLHFLIGFLLYRDVVRMNRVLKTKQSTAIQFLSYLYLGLLIVILIAFILGWSG